MIMWALWNGRNRFVFDGIREEPCEVVGKVARLWTNFSEAANRQGSQMSRPRDIWRPPREGVYKINVDGAVFANSHCVGLGVMISDCEGQAIALGAKKLRGSFTATVLTHMASNRKRLFFLPITPTEPSVLTKMGR